MPLRGYVAVGCPLPTSCSSVALRPLPHEQMRMEMQYVRVPSCMHACIHPQPTTVLSCYDVTIVVAPSITLARTVLIFSISSVCERNFCLLLWQ